MTVVVDESCFKGVAAILDVMPERVIQYRSPALEFIFCNATWAAGHDLPPTDVIGHAYIAPKV